MEFGWINLCGAAIVILIMIPNILYAVKQKPAKMEKALPPYLSICEQIGRYGCIVLMWLPLFVWKFGFKSVEALVVYLVANVVLLLGYYFIWPRYAKSKALPTAMALAVIPTIIFLLSGMLLNHWALVASAALFGLSHCRITYLTHK